MMIEILADEEGHIDFRLETELDLIAKLGMQSICTSQIRLPINRLEENFPTCYETRHRSQPAQKGGRFINIITASHQ